MSYLSQPASKTEFGLVTIGDNINVDDTGLISVPALEAGTGVTVVHSGDIITISSTSTSVINTVGVTADYTATVNDEYIGVNSTFNVTVTLPAGDDGLVYSIKDEHGAGSGKITIQPQFGNLIDGRVTYELTSPHQCITIVFRSTGWWII